MASLLLFAFIIFDELKSVLLPISVSLLDRYRPWGFGLLQQPVFTPAFDILSNDD